MSVGHYRGAAWAFRLSASSGTDAPGHHRKSIGFKLSPRGQQGCLHCDLGDDDLPSELFHQRAGGAPIACASGPPARDVTIGHIAGLIALSLRLKTAARLFLNPPAEAHLPYWLWAELVYTFLNGKTRKGEENDARGLAG